MYTIVPHCIRHNGAAEELLTAGKHLIEDSGATAPGESQKTKQNRGIKSLGKHFAFSEVSKLEIGSRGPKSQLWTSIGAQLTLFKVNLFLVY